MHHYPQDPIDGLAAGMHGGAPDMRDSRPGYFIPFVRLLDLVILDMFPVKGSPMDRTDTFLAKVYSADRADYMFLLDSAHIDPWSAHVCEVPLFEVQH